MIINNEKKRKQRLPAAEAPQSKFPAATGAAPPRGEGEPDTDSDAESRRQRDPNISGRECGAAVRRPVSCARVAVVIGSKGRAGPRARVYFFWLIRYVPL